MAILGLQGKKGKSHWLNLELKQHKMNWPMAFTPHMTRKYRGESRKDLSLFLPTLCSSAELSSGCPLQVPDFCKCFQVCASLCGKLETWCKRKAVVVVVLLIWSMSQRPYVFLVRKYIMCVHMCEVYNFRYKSYELLKVQECSIHPFSWC